MTERLDRLDDWSDRLSPIVVKEIRQMVRSREFNYSFGITLLVGFIIAFFGLADALTSAGTSGAKVFMAQMVCLGLLGLVVVPLSAFHALRNERVDQTLDLITQTTLTARNIVTGKILTQWVKLILLFAGLAPFMTMSFLLGGIDLTTILVSLAILFMWSMWVCAACLFLSAASQSRAVSAVVFIGMAIAGLWVLASASSFIFFVVGAPAVPRLSLSGETGWIIAASTALCLVSMTNLMLLAVNRLSLAIEDRSTSLRVGFFVQFLLIMACIVGPLLAGSPGYTRANAAEVIGIFCGFQLALTSIFAVTEDMVLSRRVFRRVRRGLKWPWMAIFRPGGGRGALWILTQMLVLLAAAWMLDPGKPFYWVLAICSYICFFSGTPTVILRHFFKSRLRTAYFRAGILLFFPIVGVSADLLQYLLTPNLVFDGTFSAYHMLNPFRALANWIKVEEQGWQWWPMLMGFVGLLAYLELFRLGRREDKHAANPPHQY
jgi:hypothetical protein